MIMTMMTHITKKNTLKKYENIARIAKAASHKLPGKSNLNVSFVLSCPVPEVEFVNAVTASGSVKWTRF